MIAATCYFVHSFAIYFKKARHKSTLVFIYLNNILHSFVLHVAMMVARIAEKYITHVSDIHLITAYSTCR